jgi:glycine cleavage system transcriptional repressor
VASVLVPDRVGILRDITSAVTDFGAAIDGISQTVVEGYFTVILTASLAGQRTAPELAAAIQANFPEGVADIVVRPYADPDQRPPAAGRERYVVIVTGPNRPAVLKTVTTFLAQRYVNIETWDVRYDDPYVTHVGEVTVPALLDIKQMQDELRHLMAQLGMTTCIQHENIFRATNEVGPIRPLLTEAPRA